MVETAGGWTHERVVEAAGAHRTHERVVETAGRRTRDKVAEVVVETGGSGSRAHSSGCPLSLILENHLMTKILT